MTRPETERFWEKVDRTGGPDACWPWQGALVAGGYGQFRRGRAEGGKLWFAHRLSYLYRHGTIPDGPLDHLCHSNDMTCSGGDTCPHRRCCNPTHAEPVTVAENCRRGVHARKDKCVNGHALVGANVYRAPSQPNKRFCRECGRTNNRRAYHRRKDRSEG